MREWKWQINGSTGKQRVQHGVESPNSNLLTFRGESSAGSRSEAQDNNTETVSAA